MKQTSTGLVLAPVLLRGCASLIDLAILQVVSIPITSALGLTEKVNAETMLATSVLLAVYNIGFLVAQSATLGKIAMRLYVAYPDGSAIRPDTAILRFLIMFVTIVSGVGILIDIVLVIVDPQRRAIHDRVAGTIVLAGRAGAPLRPDDLSEQGPSRPL